LGRELPNFLNLNLNPASVQTATITVADSTGAGPLPNGFPYQVSTYTAYGNTGLFGASAANFTNITQVTSNVNSSYNAMVVEVLNRSLKSLQFDANYTWSHSLDFAQNANTGTSSNSWYDPFSNARANYGNSSWNIPNRLVGYMTYNLPNLHSNNVLKQVTNGWSFDDSFQIQDGLPYSVGLSGSNSYNAISSGWNGAGGSSFIPGIGLNTKRIRRKMVDDIRVQKEIGLGERYHMQLMANVFNLANHQNFDGVTSTAYILSTCGSSCPTAGTATYQSNYGQLTSSNSSSFTYTPRNIEIAAKFTF